MKFLLTVLLVATAFPPPAVSQNASPPFDVALAVRKGCERIVSLQEGEGEAEWPYEGVYRYRGRIPIGYRIGGTAICGLALIESPGLGRNAKREKAVAKAVDFILDGLKSPLMSDGFHRRGYDVRGWGHTYALLFMLRLEELELVPGSRRTKVHSATKWLVRVLQDMAIPESGGWNYSRRAPGGYKDKRNSASPFMTAPTLQALFHAKSRGHEVATHVVKQGLDALERGRTDSGGYAYASPSKPATGRSEEALGFMDRLPGAIGRMSAVESTLMLGGRGSQKRLRGAVDAFFQHWNELEKRRKARNTHVPPYGIAPYYFIYAHYYVAQAIELLPEKDREPYRERLRGQLARVREESGGWNGRHFPRSENYGTAMVVMALQMKDIPRIPAWKP